MTDTIATTTNRAVGSCGTSNFDQQLHVELRTKLNYANKQLEKFNKILAEKDRIIDCLGSDLENILDQLDTLMVHNNPSLQQQWVGRNVPGINSAN